MFFLDLRIKVNSHFNMVEYNQFNWLYTTIFIPLFKIRFSLSSNRWHDQGWQFIALRLTAHKVLQNYFRIHSLF